MELRENHSEKRRRRIVQKTPVLVRSVKPGQNSVQSWERDNVMHTGFWRNRPAA